MSNKDRNLHWYSSNILQILNHISAFVKNSFSPYLQPLAIAILPFLANDCGMYVIYVAEYLCKQQQNSSQKSLDIEVTPAEVQRKRNEVKKIIERLRENRLDKS